MKISFSLRWQILAWFFVNLAVIGAALFFSLREQFRVGIDSLLAGPTGARIEAIAQPLAAQLRGLPEAQWSAALERATGSGLEKFLLIAGSPRLYWAGVHLDSAPGAAPFSATLLLASDSLRGGGLFFDYTPWLWLGGGLVLLSALLWLPFVHRLTRSLALLTRNAEAIAQGKFEPLREIGSRDEIGRLNRAHRNMAVRLDGFVAGQTARTHETGGTGLGLAIVKSCIEACGGRVAVQNRTPRGLQLDFTLQRAPAA